MSQGHKFEKHKDDEEQDICRSTDSFGDFHGSDFRYIGVADARLVCDMRLLHLGLVYEYNCVNTDKRIPSSPVSSRSSQIHIQ